MNNNVLARQNIRSLHTVCYIICTHGYAFLGLDKSKKKLFLFNHNPQCGLGLLVHI